MSGNTDAHLMKNLINQKKIRFTVQRGHKLVKISHFSLMLSYGKILTSGVRCGGVANFSFEFDTFVLSKVIIDKSRGEQLLWNRN